MSPSASKIVAATGCLLLVVASGAPAAPTAVAVLNFTNQVVGGDGERWKWLEKGLADMLITDLAREPRLQLVSREQMQQAVGRLEQSGGNLPEWQPQAARQLKAARAVFGTYRVEGQEVVLTATVLDMDRAQPVASVEARGKVDEVLKAEKELAGKTAAALLGDVKPGAFAAALPVWTNSQSASRWLYEGVDAFDHGHFDEAWLKARLALEQDAGYADAQYWAGRMYYYQNRYEHAAADLRAFIDGHRDHPRTRDAIREYVEARMENIKTADESVAFFRGLEAWAGDALIYEPHGILGTDSATTIPLRVWVNMRLGQALNDQGKYWEAWLAYHTAYSQAMGLYREYLEVALDPNNGIVDPQAFARSHPGGLMASTLTVLCAEWNNLWIDGRRAAREFPQEAVVVAPGQAGPALSVEGKRLQAAPGVPCRLPLVVAPEGFLITGVAIHAESDSGRLFVTLRGCRDLIIRRADGVRLTGGLQLEAGAGNGAGHKGESFTLDRGVPCVGFDVEGQSGSWANFQVEATLTAAGDLAALHVDGLAGSQVQVRLLAPGANPNDFSLAIDSRLLVRPDLFPQEGAGGWRPGKYTLYTINESMYGGGSFRPMNVELASNQPAKAVAQRYSREGFVSKDGLAVHGLAAAGGYPTYLLPNALPQMLAWPYVMDTEDGERRHTVSTGLFGGLQAAMVEESPGHLLACWQYRQNLWQARSQDGGKTWSAQERMPTPVNSAHRQMSPYLFRDSMHRYCLAFISDRNEQHALSPYLCVSTDLAHWSGPQRIGTGEAGYLFLYQDAQNQYVMILDGKESVWARKSKDLVTWTEPQRVITWHDATAMYEPRVLRDGRGQYLLAVLAIRALAKGGGSASLVVATSADGDQWGEPRSLADGKDNISTTGAPFVFPAGEGFVVGDMNNRGQTTLWHGDGRGGWWLGALGSGGMIGMAFGHPCVLSDGRVLVSGTFNDQLYCNDAADLKKLIEEAHQHVMQQAAGATQRVPAGEGEKGP